MTFRVRCLMEAYRVVIFFYIERVYVEKTMLRFEMNPYVKEDKARYQRGAIYLVYGRLSSMEMKFSDMFLYNHNTGGTYWFVEDVCKELNQITLFKLHYDPYMPYMDDNHIFHFQGLQRGILDSLCVDTDTPALFTCDIDDFTKHTSVVVCEGATLCDVGICDWKKFVESCVSVNVSGATRGRARYGDIIAMNEGGKYYVLNYCPVSNTHLMIDLSSRRSDIVRPKTISCILEFECYTVVSKKELRADIIRASREMNGRIVINTYEMFDNIDETIRWNCCVDYMREQMERYDRVCKECLFDVDDEDTRCSEDNESSEDIILFSNSDNSSSNYTESSIENEYFVERKDYESIFSYVEEEIEEEDVDEDKSIVEYIDEYDTYSSIDITDITHIPERADSDTIAQTYLCEEYDDLVDTVSTILYNEPIVDMNLSMDFEIDTESPKNTDESYIEKLIVDMRNLKLSELELVYESPATAVTHNPFGYLDQYESGSECYDDVVSSESEYKDPYYSEFVPENPDEVSDEEDDIVLFTKDSSETVSDIIVKSVEEEYVSQQCDDDAVVSEVFTVSEPDEEYFEGEYDVVDVPKSEAVETHEDVTTSRCNIM